MDESNAPSMPAPTGAPPAGPTHTAPPNSSEEQFAAPPSHEFSQSLSGVDGETTSSPSTTTQGGQRHDSMFNPRKLFIGGVDQDVTQSEFQAFWEKYGELEDCIVIADAYTGKNRGFGFVVFKDKAHTDQVLAEAGSFEMNGRRLDVKKAVPRAPRKGSRGGYHSRGRHPGGRFSSGWHGGWGGPRQDPYFVPDASYDVRYAPGYDGSADPRSGGRHGGSFGRSRSGGRSRTNTQGKLFVGQLPDDITKEQFGDYFGKFGELSDCVVMFDAAKRSRRFGFVTFADPSVADTVLQSGPHYIPSANSAETPLVVERATPRGERSRDYGPYQHAQGSQRSWQSYPAPRGYPQHQGYADRAYDPYYAHDHDWYQGGYSNQMYQQPPGPAGYGPARPPHQSVAYQPY